MRERRDYPYVSHTSSDSDNLLQVNQRLLILCKQNKMLLPLKTFTVISFQDKDMTKIWKNNEKNGVA